MRGEVRGAHTHGRAGREGVRARRQPVAGPRRAAQRRHHCNKRSCTCAPRPQPGTYLRGRAAAPERGGQRAGARPAAGPRRAAPHYAHTAPSHRSALRAPDRRRTHICRERAATPPQHPIGSPNGLGLPSLRRISVLSGVRALK